MNTTQRTFSIGQLAEKTGLTRRALRIYEQAGLLVPERAANDYRSYTERQVEEAMVIRDLRGAGLSLKVIGELVAIKRTGHSVEQKLTGFVRVLDEMEAELLEKRRAIETALQQIADYRRDAEQLLAEQRQHEERTP